MTALHDQDRRASVMRLLKKNRIYPFSKEQLSRWKRLNTRCKVPCRLEGCSLFPTIRMPRSAYQRDMKQRQSAAIPSRQQGQRKRILQGALCLLKSGSYLPFPSLPPLAKAAVAPTQMQVSCLPGFQRPAYLHPQPVSVLPELRAIARGTPCCKKCVLPWYPAATVPR